MSASAINPVPSPSLAAGPATAASGAAGAAHATQAQDPLAAFEAMLASLFGVKDPAAGAAAGAGKTPADGKTADGKVADGKKGKDQASDDDQTVATADATGAANPNLALLTPTAATLPATAPPAQASTDDPVQPAIANVASASDKVATNAAALAEAANAAASEANPDAKGAASKVAAQTAEPVSLPAAPSAVTSTAAATAKTDASAATAPTPAAESAQAPTTPPPAAAPAPEAPAVTAAVVPPPAAPTARKTADPVAPAAPRERIQATKTSTRVEAVKAQAAPGGIAALTAKAAEALQPVSGGAPNVDADDEPVQEAPPEAKADAGAAPQAPANPATAATTTPTNLIHAAAVAVRGQPQTVANLAAQIVKKLDSRTSQFDVQLDPAGLGKVDVRIAIGADGRMSAAMSFDTPQAAAELKARAGELHQAMAQAGFDLTGGMSFDVASDPGQGQGQGNQAQTQDQQTNTGAAFRGRAFQTALDTSADAVPPQFMRRRTALAGVDIRT